MLSLGMAGMLRGVAGLWSVAGKSRPHFILEYIITDYSQTTKVDKGKGVTVAKFKKTRLGDYQLDWQKTFIDPKLKGRAWFGIWIHELIHRLTNRYLPNAAYSKNFAGQRGLLGFIGSNVKFYEESLAYFLEGLVKFSWREFLGFSGAWSKSHNFAQKGESPEIYHRHIIEGLSIAAGAIIALMTGSSDD